MSYQDELRELALKKEKRNHRNRLISLVIFLIVVLFIINYLGSGSEKIENGVKQMKNKTNQEQTRPQENAN